MGLYVCGLPQEVGWKLMLFLSAKKKVEESVKLPENAVCKHLFIFRQNFGSRAKWSIMKHLQYSEGQRPSVIGKSLKKDYVYTSKGC